MKALIFGGNSLVRCTAVALLAVGMNMVPGGDASAARVAAGDHHTLAIKGDGTVWGWGGNSYGQLGNVTITDKTAIPVQVTGLTRITSVSASAVTSAAVKSDGRVWAWGSSISLTPVVVSGLTNAIAVAAADPLYGAKFVALKSDGTVWTWSYSSAGVNTAPVQVAGLSDIKAIDKGYHALKVNGTVWTWGYTGATQTGPVMQPGLVNVQAIAVGSAHTLALKTDGTVWAWGNNAFGQLGNGTQIDSVTPVQAVGLSNIKSIAATDFRARSTAPNTVPNGTASQAVKADGTVWMWGSNSHGQIHAVVNLGGIFNQPRQIMQAYTFTGSPILANIEAAVGSFHAISLRSDGYALGWGENAAGQGGTGSYNGLSVPLHPTQVVTTF